MNINPGQFDVQERHEALDFSPLDSNRDDIVEQALVLRGLLKGQKRLGESGGAKFIPTAPDRGSRTVVANRWVRRGVIPCAPKSKSEPAVVPYQPENHD